METALKQRLVGAMVLVALAVIFLPMLIKGPAPESGVADVSLDPPDAPESGFETHELPLVAPSADAASGALPAVPAPERLPTVEAGNRAADAAMMPAPTAGGDYAVSFGSYASQADAARVVAALKASQLPGYQDAVTASDARTLHRVRIGPYATQAEAEAARLRAAHVRDDVGSKVVVLDATASAPTTAAPTSPAASAPAPAAAASKPVALAASRPVQQTPLTEAPAASKPAAAERASAAKNPEPPAPEAATPRAGAADVGFAVQLGAFGNADEAAKLRDRARAAGFSAFVEQVRTDKGTLNRVRIGPVADRADADRLREDASSQLGVSGLVRPHP